MINTLLAAVARQHRLSADEAEEFASVARLRMISDDYAILRKFQARCTLRTFLTVVIQRMFLDYRAAMWGKWRPSARSRKEGGVAILLERLTMRDGLTFEEAYAVLNTNHAFSAERDTLERIYAGFRARSRPRSVSDDELAETPAPHGSADEAVLRGERERIAARATQALTAAVAKLGPEDRLILKFRFCDRVRVADIARILRLDQKALYRRLDRIMRQLRSALETAGVSAREVLGALNDEGMNLGQVLGHDDLELPPAQGSHAGMCDDAACPGSQISALSGEEEIVQGE